jgi:Protein of unknown function (DUF2946)
MRRHDAAPGCGHNAGMLMNMREVRFMLRPLRARRGMRSWVAMVAAYALALQVLLSGLAAGGLLAAADASAGELFVICHGSGNGPSNDQGLPDDPQLPHAPCVLCTLAQAPCAVLPVDHAVMRLPAIVASNVVPGNDGRIFRFDSPTGRYQRGPPARAVIFG